MTHEYYAPSEGIYQHYACAKNGKVLLCNDSDGEYEQVFGSPEELHRFIDHLQEVADKAWPDHDLCVDIAEMLERLQGINPEQYAWWYSALYPIDNSIGDKWTKCTLATLRNLVRWKGYGEAGAIAALNSLHTNNSEGLQRLADDGYPKELGDFVVT
jgi:hypothetical protein